jgi:hypothetical protein
MRAGRFGTADTVALPARDRPYASGRLRIRLVIPGLVPGIPVLNLMAEPLCKDVDGRDQPGRDDTMGRPELVSITPPAQAEG